MKITYSKDEALALMQNHIASLLDVKVTEIEISAYSDDFLRVTCIQASNQYAVDESYSDNQVQA